MERVAEVCARAERLLARAPSADLAESNALATDVAALCAATRAHLAAAGGRDRGAVVEYCARLVALTRLQDRLREHVTAGRFDTLERIHQGLGRLRTCSSTAALLPRAAEELAACCNFDRTLVSAVRGESWRAEAVWIAPDHDPELSRRIADYVTGAWIPLRSGCCRPNWSVAGCRSWCARRTTATPSTSWRSRRAGRTWPHRSSSARG